MKKILICTACVIALSSSSALAQEPGDPLYCLEFPRADICVDLSPGEPMPPQPIEPRPDLYGEPLPQGALTTKVYFANGVGNTQIQANKLTHLLRRLYKNVLSPGVYYFYTSYNPTEGILSDLREVKDQKNDELLATNPGLSQYTLAYIVRYWLSLEKKYSDKEAVRKIRNSLKFFNPPLNPKSIQAITPKYLNRLEEQLKKRMVNLSLPTRLRVTGKHAFYYARDLKDEIRVFVVAHSQGNLFSNVALETAAKRVPKCASSLDMIGVATPAAPGKQFAGPRLQPQPFYQTADDDGVIYTLSFIKSVLRLNVDNDLWWFGDPRDLFNHSFKKGYMLDVLPSRKNIDSRIMTQAWAVRFPRNC